MAESKAMQKIKKKKWYGLYSKLFNNAYLGETMATEDNDLIGRAITVNLATLSGDIKRQAVSVGLVVSSVKDGKAQTDVVKYLTSPASIRRLVRRNVERIDTVVACPTKDGITVNVKIFCLAKSKTSGSVSKVLQRECRLLMIKEVAKLDYPEFVWSLIEHRVQSDIKKVLGKIYPLKAFEVKMFEVVHDAGKKEKPAEIIETPQSEEKGSESA
jgi:ribosomal protein S3AE